jgi:hypothetical protein
MSIERAIAQYMMAKGLNVQNGNYDKMIQIWTDILSLRYSEEEVIAACRVASMKPGRPEVSHIAESAQHAKRFAGAL